jgi:hypothetical protein
MEQQVLLKRPFILNGLHNIVRQKRQLFITTAAITPYPAQIIFRWILGLPEL